MFDEPLDDDECVPPRPALPAVRDMLAELCRAGEEQPDAAEQGGSDV
jgi:hypothetical protein